MSDYPSTIETARTATASRDNAETSSTRARLDEAVIPDSTVDRFVRSGAFLVLFGVVFGMAWGIW